MAAAALPAPAMILIFIVSTWEDLPTIGAFSSDVGQVGTRNDIFPGLAQSLNTFDQAPRSKRG